MMFTFPETVPPTEAGTIPFTTLTSEMASSLIVLMILGWL